eukprot:COSAG02_NODE_3686_length_6384_cov_22.292920_1_plen_98_part_00
MLFFFFYIFCFLFFFNSRRDLEMDAISNATHVRYKVQLYCTVARAGIPTIPVVQYYRVYYNHSTGARTGAASAVTLAGSKFYESNSLPTSAGRFGSC